MDDKTKDEIKNWLALPFAIAAGVLVVVFGPVLAVIEAFIQRPILTICVVGGFVWILIFVLK